MITFLTLLIKVLGCIKSIYMNFVTISTLLDRLVQNVIEKDFIHHGTHGVPTDKFSPALSQLVVEI